MRRRGRRRSRKSGTTCCGQEPYQYSSVNLQDQSPPPGLWQGVLGVQILDNIKVDSLEVGFPVHLVHIFEFREVIAVPELEGVEVRQVLALEGPQVLYVLAVSPFPALVVELLVVLLPREGTEGVLALVLANARDTTKIGPRVFGEHRWKLAHLFYYLGRVTLYNSWPMFLSFFKSPPNVKNPFIDFYRNAIAVSCIFRALDDLSQALILRLMKEEFSISEINMQLMVNDNEIARTKLAASLAFLKSMCILWERESGLKHTKSFTLNENFRSSLERYLTRPEQLTWVPVSPDIQEDQPVPLYNFLYDPKSDIVRKVLVESKLIQPQGLTKDGFSFVLEDISTQICILLKGYTKYKGNLDLWESILEISNLDFGKAYHVKKEWSRDLIRDLGSFKFVTVLAGENGDDYISVNRIFRNFSFQEPNIDLSLKCDIIVETNFKVYAHVKATKNRTNHQVLRKILELFVQLDFEDSRIEQLIVGSLVAHKVKQAYNKGISADQILKFFRKHTDIARVQETMKKTQVVSKTDQVYNQKRAKLKFLKIYSKDEHDILPNNVIQQLKLWEEMKDWDKDMEIEENDEENEIY